MTFKRANIISHKKSGAVSGVGQGNRVQDTGKLMLCLLSLFETRVISLLQPGDQNFPFQQLLLPV